MRLSRLKPSKSTLATFLLTALGAGIVAGAMIGILLGDLSRQKSETTDKIRQGAVFKARLMGDHATRTFENIDLILFSLAGELAGGERMPNRDHAQKKLRERLIFQPQATNLALYDARGDLVADVKKLDANENVLGQTFFARHARDGLSFFLDGPLPRRFDAAKRQSLRLSRLVARGDGGLMGVLLAEIDPSFFNGYYREEDLGQEDLVALTGETGRIMASEATEVLPLGAMLAEVEIFKEAQLAKVPPGGLQIVETARWLIVFNQLANFPMRVMVAEDMDKALANWRQTAKETRLIVLGLILSYLCVLAVVGLVLRRRQAAEEALKASEAHLRAIYENTDVGILRIDNQGNIVAHNPAFGMMMGAKDVALVGRNVMEITHPDDREASLANFNRMRAGAFDRYRFEKRYLRVDNRRPIWVKVSAVTVNPADPDPLIFAMIEDITEGRHAKDTIETLLKRSQLLISAVGEGILGLDSSGRIAFVNPAAESLLGFGAKEMIGQPSHQLLHHHRPDGTEHPESECPIHAVLNDGQPRHVGNDAFWTKKGARLPVEYVATPMISDSGIEGSVIAFRDISSRLAADEEIKRSNAELEQFAYAVSHDLQEPLRMVASYVQLLGRRYQGKLDQDADTFIGFAVDGAKRMQQMITDLLDYSRVQRKGNPMTPQSLDGALQAALQNLALAVGECGAEVEVKGPMPTVNADGAQMTRLFQNLIGNALKYRDKQRKPKISVSASQQGGAHVIAIEDNGIGIDPQYFERIFQIFQRLHARSEYPGTGIGLAICRRIVERHGGKIWVQSKPGEGSTFFFQLPLTQQAS